MVQELNANLLKTLFVSYKIRYLKKGQFNDFLGLFTVVNLEFETFFNFIATMMKISILDGYDITRETFPTDATDILT